MATLLIQLPSGASQIHRLGPDPVVVGRSLEADINLIARGVSRRHCLITPRNGNYTLTDLGSKNGSYLNDDPVERASLHHNDSLAIGEARIIFYADEDDAEDTRRSVRTTGSDLATPSPSDERPWVEKNISVILEGVDEEDERDTDRSEAPAQGDLGAVFEEDDDQAGWVAESGLAGMEETGGRPSGAASGASRSSARGSRASFHPRASAVEQQLLYQQYLVDALQEFGGATSWGRLVDLAAARLFRAFRLERVFLLGVRQDHPDPELLYLSEQPLAERHHGPSELRYSSRAVKQVITGRQPILISLLASEDDPNYKPGASYMETGAQLSMLAPVIREGQLYGVLHADSFVGGEQITRKDLRLFAALADALGIALGQLEARRSASSIAAVEDERRITSPGHSVPDDEAMQTLKMRGGADREASVEVSALLVRAIPPANWFETGSPGGVQAELTHALLSRFFSLASEIVDEQGGHVDGIADLMMPCIFTVAPGAGTRSHRAVEAAVMIMLALSEWLSDQGGIERAPQAAVAVCSGRALRWSPGERDRIALTWGGGPISRLSALGPRLQPGQLLLDGATMSAMGEDSRFGDLRTAKPQDPGGVTWMELGWKIAGGGAHVVPKRPNGPLS